MYVQSARESPACFNPLELCNQKVLDNIKGMKITNKKPNSERVSALNLDIFYFRTL